MKYDDIITSLDTWTNEETVRTGFTADNKNIFDYLNSSLFTHSKIKKAILGIDIYKYSQYKGPCQDIIPFIFEAILRRASSDAATFSSFLYQNFETQINDSIISTGDGGFILFDNPLQAVIFLLHFNLIVKHYNSFLLFKDIREILGPLTLRYSMTYDYVFNYENNFFGPAIIANARILSKDKLNRFLIDHNVFEWFDKYTFGMENLTRISIEDLIKTDCFSQYNPHHGVDWFIKLKDPFITDDVGISDCDVAKIGEIKIKDDILNVYNAIITYTTYNITEVGLSPDIDKQKINISVGNYNTTGIEI